MPQDQKKRKPSFERPKPTFKPKTNGPDAAQAMLDEIDELLTTKQVEETDRGYCGC